MSEQLVSSTPEVSLAINTAPTTEAEEEDFFFEHGFEYIDAHRDGSEDVTDDIGRESSILTIASRIMGA
jgi:hypothetical protein